MSNIEGNYCILTVLEMEEGLMIVYTNNKEKHLAYINSDREVFLKDGSNLESYEIDYINDLAKQSSNPVFNKVHIIKDSILGHYHYHKKFTEAGYSGVLSNGNIIDRRIYPKAIAMKKNSLFGIPHPK